METQGGSLKKKRRPAGVNLKKMLEELKLLI